MERFKDRFREFEKNRLDLIAALYPAADSLDQLKVAMNPAKKLFKWVTFIGTCTAVAAAPFSGDVSRLVLTVGEGAMITGIGSYLVLSIGREICDRKINKDVSIQFWL